jgi:hypothetical protein
MANPRDPSFALNGEFYMNEKDGRTHIRVPAGGSGGGVTTYFDVLATEDEHLAFLDSQAKLKEAEALAHREKHKQAHEEMKKKTEIYFNADDGLLHKRLPGTAPNVLDPLATPDEEKAYLAKSEPPAPTQFSTDVPAQP